MKSKNVQSLYKVGYYISLFGAALILLWIGVFKFTHAEAQGIKPLIENSFLFSWLYSFLSLQAVSNLIGVIEILIGLSFVGGIFSVMFRKIAFVGAVITFLLTLSFLFTTPNMWRFIEGVPYTDFFILKDVMLLGFAFISLNPPSKA